RNAAAGAKSTKRDGPSSQIGRLYGHRSGRHPRRVLLHRSRQHHRPLHYVLWPTHDLRRAHFQCGRLLLGTPDLKSRHLRFSDPMEMIGSLLLGSSLALLGWWFVRTMTEVDEEADEWRYDRVRIAELKRHDSLYRLLYPLFVPLARINRSLFHGSL